MLDGRRSRKALNLCSSLAIATALVVGANSARAQSFQGTGTFNSGTGTITTGTGTTTIDITSTNAVINWSPTDTAISNGTPIIFQPANTTATFQSTGDFSVLNRILPTDSTRPIQFNGTVISQLLGAAPTTGGTVYFYSPGGLIIGSGAVFNVGNLGLTSAAPLVDVNGAFDATDVVTFQQANPGTKVEIQSGARITGAEPSVGSYLAVVAPVVVNAGTIDSKRVSALVSADAAVMTLNVNGLFDIQVTSGTSGTGTTLSNTGSITGPAGASGAANRVYLVAVPKNQAITMAIGAGSTLGFDVAAAADVVNNAVVLSAGYDIVGGATSTTPSAGGGTGQASIDVAAPNVTSAIDARATGRTLFFANAGQTGSFASDVSIAGTQNSPDTTTNAVQFIANGAGAQMNVAGNLTVTALDPTLVAPSTGYQVSNFAVVDAVNGGNMSISGNVSVTNDKTGADNQSVIAGSARIAANSGSQLNIGGNLTISARGTGGQGTQPGVLSTGSGKGGSANIFANTGADITIGGNVSLDASGFAGTTRAIGVDGGDGTGGSIDVGADGDGSSITIGGRIDASAAGFGGNGSGCTTCGDDGGVGRGGTIFVNSRNGAALVDITGAVVLDSSGFGGNSQSSLAGNGFGGLANFSASQTGTTRARSSVDLYADSFGGSFFGSSATGAAANGSLGEAAFGAFMGGTLIVDGVAFASSRSQGGDTFVDGTAAGNASGGIAQVFEDSTGSITFNSNVILDATAFGGLHGGNGVGGDAQGGQARAISYNTGTASMTFLGGVDLAADAFGGTTGECISCVVKGGNAVGGTARIGADAANKTISISGPVNISAQASGGASTGGASPAGNVAGTATGGQANIAVNGAGSSVTASLGVSLDASASGGVALSAGLDGGNAVGGSAVINVNSGTASFAQGALVSALGSGGDSVTGTGGSGTGGSARIDVGTNGTVTLASAGISANSAGGNSSSGTGGNANAGRAQLFAGTGANVTLGGALALSADTRGGDGVNGGNAFNDPTNANARALISAVSGTLAVSGATTVTSNAAGGAATTGIGGKATSGFALVFAGNGNVATAPRGSMTLANLTVQTSATGGASASGDGGDAGAGRSQLFVNGGDITVNGPVTLSGDATGGNGINGGDAISERPFRQPRALIGSFNGTINVTGVTTLTAKGTGGNGSLGGAGGIGFAGGAAVDAQSQNGPSAINLTSVNVDATGTGGRGGDGSGSQAGGAGGDGYGGETSLTGNAGQGTLTLTGTATLSATGTGGVGGTGGSGGTVSPGANGGAGGRGFGGSVQVGSASGVATATNTGSANFVDVTGSGSAFGGAGGAGGTGTTTGLGGAGGAAYGGFVGILSRGSPANFRDVTLTAFGTGGNGGSGSTAGVGGNGAAGDGFVTATQRFQRTERGSLTARNVSITSGGVGGAGSTAGLSYYAAAQGATEGEFTLRQADLTIANLTLTTSGALAPNYTVSNFLGIADPTVSGVPTLTSVTVVPEPFDIRLSQGTANVTGNFTMTTPGDMRISLDAANLNTGVLTLSAGNFVLPASRPATLGTISASSGASIGSALDFAAYANFAFGFSASFSTVGAISIGDLTANGPLTATAGTSITVGNVAGGTVTLQGSTGLTTGAISSTGAIVLRSNASPAIGSILTGAITGGSLDAQGGNISVQGVTTTGTTLLASNGPVSSGAISASAITVQSAQTYTGGNLTATGNIDVGTLGGITAGTVQSGPLAKFRSNGNIALGNITSTGRVDVNTNGQVAVGNVVAGSGGTFTVGIGSNVGPVTIGNITAQGLVAVGTGTTLTVGNVIATDLLGFVGTGTSSFGSISTGTLSPATGTLTPGGRVLIQNGTQFALGGNIDAFDPAPIFAAPLVASAGAIAINGPVSTGRLDASSNQNLTITGATQTVQSATLLSGQALSTGAITSGTAIQLRGLGSLTAGALQSGTNVFLGSAGSIATGGLSAGSQILALAGTGLSTGALSTAIVPGARIYFGNFSMESLGGQIGATFDPAPIVAANPVAIGGPVAINGTVNGVVLQTNSTGPLSISGNASLLGAAVLQSGGNITAANIDTGDRAIIAGAGAVTLGNVTSGTAISPSPTAKVAIAGGSVSAGNVAAFRDLGIQSSGSISTGNLAGRDVLLLAGGNLSTGSIIAGTATAPQGRVYIGNVSMATPTANVFSAFTAIPFFGTDPVRTGGSITFGGGVSAGSLYASAGQGISLLNVTTPAISPATGSGGFIDLDAGGTVSVNGRLAAGDRIDIASGDIDIGANGSIDALSSVGEIQLASNNAAGAFIGDGLTAPSGSYQLSNAEYGRLKAGQIAVIGDDLANATDMTVGDLTIAASQLYGSSGVALFATGNRATSTPSGILRIAGAVNATGFTPTNEIDILSGAFELETTKGSIKVSDGAGALGGLVTIEAKNIHVASDGILTKLRADPLYSGYIQDLNAPSNLQPGGVLNALALGLAGSDTIYVQNTGSATVPAGFVTTLSDSTDIGGDTTPPTGGRSVVINGQLVTADGTLTGRAAFDAAVTKAKADATANGETFGADLQPDSTFNACVILTGVCAVTMDPVAAISSEIVVVTQAVLDESPTAPAADDADEGGDDSADEQKDEDSDTDEGASPISPPQPLINTRPLSPDVQVVEPVSGAGNPALFGSAVDESTAQGEPK